MVASPMERTRGEEPRQWGHAVSECLVHMCVMAHNCRQPVCELGKQWSWDCCF